MARLRTLTLPPYRRDGDNTQPFALVLDRCPDGLDADEWRRFAERCGAADLIVTGLDVDLDDTPAEIEIPEELFEQLAVFVREQVQHALTDTVLLRPGSGDDINARLGDLGLLPSQAGTAPAGQQQGPKPRSTWGDPSQPDPRAKIPGWAPPQETDLIGSAVDEAVNRG